MDTESDGIKRMSVKEFREQGYLQEVNRQFLHPRGLALEVVVEDDGTERLGGIWDYRGDPEGIIYGPGAEPTYEKALAPSEAWSRHYECRQERFGWIIQPLTRES